MRIAVRYFAALREAAGRERDEIDLPEGEVSVEELLQALGRDNGDLEAFLGSRPVLVAVNQEYAGRERNLKGGDEVALFPPVSGG